jgi:glucan biosynthesis protein
LDNNRLRLTGLIDGPRFTQAISAILTPGIQTTFRVKAQIFFRKPFTSGKAANMGIGLSSMFWKGEQDTPEAATDEAHDADTLVLQYDDGQQHIINLVNPPTAELQSFGSRRRSVNAFELLQTDRDTTHYSTYDDARYAQRSSIRVSRIRCSLPYRVKLYAYNTSYEGEDNVAAYIALRGNVPKARSVSDAVKLQYTVTAGP